ncbi:hypothetical protein [Evansella cellulosilytica]|uniref:Uncharacterized protein n=1 Tax=Evansella cellulosilytica (strain ATCC 21833 / DSM 2522 / FERM P-1141 / JCM 9156 / N-4) TaxID=649639 RepID=E6TYL4_EVAC2|nr:hypothetical protein [Evansella cellulosilytica]ADU30064.1 hypothetical protein Bcell_1802 [Evansella cellulosilytica DSM 2522]
MEEASKEQIHSASLSYFLEVMPHFIVFCIGFLLSPKRTEKLFIKQLSINWALLLSSIIILTIALFPSNFLTEQLHFILPQTLENHFSDIKFVIFVVGGYFMLKGLVNKEDPETHS